MAMVDFAVVKEDIESTGGTMIKSALSYAGAVLVSMLFAPLLAELIRALSRDVFNFFAMFGDGISDSLNSLLGIRTYPASFAFIPFALLIAFVWGIVAFRIKNR